MAKIKDHRHLGEKDKFLEYSFQAVKDQFKTKADFVAFYDNIKDDDLKNLFLKTASYYLFLVKNGDWHVDIKGSDKKVDYLILLCHIC